MRHKEEYRRKINIAKSIVRRAHAKYGEIFISNVKHDVYGYQTFEYKIMNVLNQEERDLANINIIPEQKLIHHYSHYGTLNRQRMNRRK